MTNRESHDRQEQGTRHKTHTLTIINYRGSSFFVYALINIKTLCFCKINKIKRVHFQITVSANIFLKRVRKISCNPFNTCHRDTKDHLMKLKFSSFKLSHLYKNQLFSVDVICMKRQMPVFSLSPHYSV